jgi:tetratricopeptide (TPR) repeat protein
MKRLVLILAVIAARAAALGAAEDPVVESRQAFLSARMAESDGKYESALADFRRAIALRPDEPVLHFELAMLLQQMGVEEEASREARKASDLDPTFESAWRLSGAIDLGAAEKQPERIAPAISSLETAHRLAPQNPATALALARAYLLDGRPDRARVTLDEVPGLADSSGAAKVRAEADDKRGADDEARHDYDRWLGEDPTDREAVTASIEFWESQRDFKRAVELLQTLRHSDADAMVVQDRIALDTLRGGRFAEAAALAREIIAKRPEDRGARRTLAAALDAQGKSAESAEMLRRLMQEDPDDPSVALTLAFQLSSAGKGDEAVALLRSFAERAAKNPGKARLVREVRSETAALLYRDRKLDEARSLAAATAIDKDSVADRSLGILLEEARTGKKPAAGLDWARKAAAAEPKNADWKAAVAEFQFRAGDRAAAEKTFAELGASGIASDVLAAADAQERLKNFAEASRMTGEALARFAGNVDLMFRRGAALERDGKFEASVAVFEDALRIRPDDANTLNYLGYMYADKGVKLPEAKLLLEKAVALDPQNGAYLDSLGWVFFRMNELDSAAKFLSQAAERIPMDATVQEHLGDLEARRGQTARAVGHWKKSLTLSPDEPEKIVRKIHDSGATP